MGLVTGLMIFIPVALNGQVIEMSVEELARDSETILFGKCTRIESSWNDKHDRIYTEVTVHAEGYLKGNEGQEVTITIPGGRVGNIIYEVSDMPSFSEGEEMVTFLTRHSSGRNLITGAVQGKLTIRRDELTGARKVRRSLTKAPSFKKSLEIFDSSNHRVEAIALDDFITEINGYVNQ